MAELYIFSQDDDLLTTLTESTGLTSAPFRDELNSVSEEPFIFTVEADTDNAKHVKEENRVVFKDPEGRFREFVIKELDDFDGIDGPETQATCLPAFLDELSENYLLNKRYTNKEAQLALNDALAGTRYIGEVQGEFGLASTNFYRLTSVDCIWKIRNTWGGDITDEVELDDKGRIAKRKIILKMRLGTDNGLRFEIDHNIEEIQRTVLSYPKTALYGYGTSLETDGGGYTRFIDFADVEWSVANGDPVDKPKGQKWVGDPNALLDYGRKHDGKLLHRFGEFYNHDIEDPEELLWATWNNLQTAKKPEVHYRLKADLLDKPASLGDTAIAIDREFARPLEIQSRIIAIEYDLLDIENTTYVEFGQFLSIDEDDVRREIEELKEVVNRPRKPINNNSFPDIKPGIPQNVQAHGAFQTIQLFWDYDSDVSISHYEVYGSQVADFIPDIQHLLYRGRVSSFSHEVNADEVWYYYVRAVNTRGTVGDFSVRVSAASRRILTNDIVFGSITADLLANNLDIADKLTQNTIDRINQAPIQYTEQQIQATQEALSEQLNNRIGDINSSIANLLERTSGIEGTVTNINQEIDMINSTMSTTIEQLSNIDGVVSQHTLTLEALPGQLSAKAEKTEVYTRTQTNNLLDDKVDLTVYNNKMTALDLSISGINGRVSNTESSIDDLTGDITSALNQIGELDIRADGIEQNVSQIETNFDGRINTAEGNITTLAGKIELKASQTSVDTLTNQMSSMQSTIDLLPDQLEAKVDVDGIIATINLSSEGLRIDGSKHHITGQTLIDEGVIGTAAIANLAVDRFHLKHGIIDNVHIQDATIEHTKIKSVDADKITVGNLRGIDIYGAQFRSSDGFTQLDITGGNIRLRQNNGRYFHQNPDGLYGYNSDGSIRFRADSTLVTSSALGTSLENVYLAAYGEARVVHYDDIPGDGQVDSYRYRAIRAFEFRSPSGQIAYMNGSGGGNLSSGHALRAAGILTTVNDFYIGVRAAGNGEVRVTDSAGYNNGGYITYRPIRAREFRNDQGQVAYMNGSGGGDMREGRTKLMASGIQTTTIDLYLGVNATSDGEVRVTNSFGYNGGSIGYRPIRASNFYQSSSIDFKTNIEPVLDVGLNIINDLKIVEYELKENIKNGIYDRQVGLISEHSSPVATKDGKAINSYTLTAYNTKAIQELDAKCIKQGDEVEWLKLEIQYLKQKIKLLEENIA